MKIQVKLSPTCSYQNLLQNKLSKIAGLPLILLTPLSNVMDNLFDNGKKSREIKQLQQDAKQLLRVWLSCPPTDQRQMQALKMFANAVLVLQAAANKLDEINVGEREKVSS